MQMPSEISVDQTATAEANGDSMQSQSTNFGDYYVSAPSWVKQSSSGLDLSSNLMVFGGIAVLFAGLYLWKLKK